MQLEEDKWADLRGAGHCRQDWLGYDVSRFPAMMCSQVGSPAAPAAFRFHLPPISMSGEGEARGASEATHTLTRNSRKEKQKIRDFTKKNKKREPEIQNSWLMAVCCLAGCNGMCKGFIYIRSSGFLIKLLFYFHLSLCTLFTLSLPHVVCRL